MGVDMLLMPGLKSSLSELVAHKTAVVNVILTIDSKAQAVLLQFSVNCSLAIKQHLG